MELNYTNHYTKIKLNKNDFTYVHSIFLQLNASPLVNISRFLNLSILDFELGISHPRLNRGVALNISLVNLSSPVNLHVSQFHFYICHPSSMIRLELHPSLKYLSCPRDITHHLLHVYILVPQLIDSRQERNGPIPNIAGVIDESIPHFHLRILEPEREMGVIGVQRSFPYTARPSVIFLLLFPLSVLK